MGKRLLLGIFIVGAVSLRAQVEVVDTIWFAPGGSGPWAVGVNPNTNKIYVANHGSDNVSVIDGATNLVIQEVAVGSEPVFIGVNPNTNLIYVSCYLDGAVWVLKDFTGVEEVDSKLQITDCKLEIHPNPFTKLTAISYQLPAKSNVSLKIHDNSGRLVETLVNEQKQPSYYTVKWKVSKSGIYFAKLMTGDLQLTKKLVLIK